MDLHLSAVETISKPRRAKASRPTIHSASEQEALASSRASSCSTERPRTRGAPPAALPSTWRPSVATGSTRTLLTAGADVTPRIDERASSKRRRWTRLPTLARSRQSKSPPGTA